MKTSIATMNETSTGLAAFGGETKVHVQLRRAARVGALTAITIAAAAEFAWRSAVQRRSRPVRWRADWQTRWARLALRAMHLRLRVFGHAPVRGVLVSNDAGPLGRLVLAALSPTLFLSEPDAIADAVAEDAVVTVFMNAGGQDRPVLERAVRENWMLAPTWIQPVDGNLWTLLLEPSVPLTIAVAQPERARGTAGMLSDSLNDQVRLLAHATGSRINAG